MIKLKNVCKYYAKDDVHAVQNATFGIKDNEIFALLGPNGAGKTTTMRMLATLSTPTSGEIWYDNLSTMSRNSEIIKQRIGFLTTELRLDGQFTPNQLAHFFGGLYGLPKEDVDKNKKALFDYFGITPFADRKYETFSTGMKQKTSIAICLVHDPDVIIFDEPTNGLDVLSQNLVEQYLVNLKERGKCVIISTHILDVAERLADRIGIIIDGRVVFCGNPGRIVEQTRTNNLREAFMFLYKRFHVEKPIAVDKKKTTVGQKLKEKFAKR